MWYSFLCLLLLYSCVFMLVFCVIFCEWLIRYDYSFLVFFFCIIKWFSPPATVLLSLPTLFCCFFCDLVDFSLCLFFALFLYCDVTSFHCLSSLCCFFFFDTDVTVIYSLSFHAALPVYFRYGNYLPFYFAFFFLLASLPCSSAS